MKNFSKFDKYEIGKVVSIIIVTLFVIWLVSQVIGSCRYDEQVNDSNNLTILLSFIGVMATFVVVGNFTQTSHVMNETREKIKEFNDEIRGIKEDISTLQEKAKNIESIQTQVAELDGNLRLQSPQVTEKDLANLLELLTAENDINKSLLLYSKLTNKESIYDVVLKTGVSKQTKSVINSNNDLEFEIIDGDRIDADQIATIDGVKFNIEKLNFAHRILHQLGTQVTGDINNEVLGDSPLKEEIGG